MIKEIKDETNPFLFKVEYIMDDKIVGTLNYTYMYDRMEIENIMVFKDYRNRHIGTKLVEYLIDKAAELKAVNITLEVNVENIAAINLYKKYGFIEVAKREKYYDGIDGILMEKKIGSD